MIKEINNPRKLDLKINPKIIEKKINTKTKKTEHKIKVMFLL